MKKPPRIGRLFFRVMTDPENGHSIIGDAEEEYKDICRERGLLYAKCWYWLQVFISLISIVKQSYYWSVAMLFSYLKIAFRNLNKYKVFSLINILGLAVGMACSALIFLWVRDEVSYDRFHEHADRICRVESVMNFSLAGKPTVWPVAPAQLAPALIKDFPEVENAVRMYQRRGMMVRYGQRTFDEQRFYCASPSIFDIFTFRFLIGDPASSFQDPFSVIITDEVSQKYFGNENPIGKTFEVNKTYIFTVTGVIKDIPRQSHIHIDFIAPFEVCEVFGDRLTDWGRFDFPTYILLREGGSIEGFQQKITHYLSKHKRGSKTQLILQPLERIHLHSESGRGNITYIYIFTLIGLTILGVACINFVNLSTARSAQRTKEIGVRKVVGARRVDLMKQLLGEAVLLSLFAFFFALILVNILLPSFNQLSGKAFTVGTIFDKDAMVGLVGIVLLTGILSGCYPALYLSSFHPIQILKGSQSKGMKDSILRKILVTGQFAASIIFVICAMVILSQIHFIRSKKLGYDKEHLIYVNLNSETREYAHILKSDLAQIPSVAGVAASDQIPVNQGNFTTITRWEGKDTDKRLIFHVMSIDHDYIDLMGMEMSLGQKFQKEVSNKGIIVNEEAIRQMEMEAPIGKKLYYWSGSDVITGVIKDFHFKPMHTEMRPLIITHDPARYNKILIKIRPENVDETVDAVKRVFLKISPDSPFQYRFLDETIDSIYWSEKRIGRIINWFTVITIFTSCLGLFGLAAFTAQNKTKEIGIRKVLGASAFKIVSLLSTEFGKLVLLANIIAWPVGYYVMHKWLQNYAYKIDLTLWIFILSGGVALLIAMLTVSFQSFRAATVNPINSLRDE